MEGTRGFVRKATAVASIVVAMIITVIGGPVDGRAGSARANGYDTSPGTSLHA